MDGIILLNKQKGCTSHDMVYKVKRLTNQKVGHTGTLDPNATGVLPLLIGKGTLISKYLTNHDKQYEAVLKLGIKTDTADIEGNILENKEVDQEIWKDGKIEQVLNSFIGKQEQVPPMYSAIKVKGKKLYEYARKGQNIEVKSRRIEITDIRLINKNIELNEITFIVDCSKGTYIRSLCEDIAKRLKTVGYMKELNRTKVGSFKIDNTISIEELKEKIKENKMKGPFYITIEEFFNNKEKIVLSERKLQLFLNGVKLSSNLEDEIYRIYDEKNEFIGLGIVEKKSLKRDVIL